MHRTKLTSANGKCIVGTTLKHKTTTTFKRFYDFIMQNIKNCTYFLVLYRKRHSMNTKKKLYYY